MRLDELAAALAVPCQPDYGAVEIRALAPLDRAGSGELSFAAGARQSDALQSARASAVLLPAALAELSPVPYLIVDEPYAAFARVSWLIDPEPRPPCGVHPNASVADDAELGPDVHIGSGAVIGAGAVIAQGAIVEAGSVLGEGVVLGARSRIYPNVTIYPRCQIGEDCRIHSGTVIGGDGFGFAPSREGWLPIRHSGRTVLGNRVSVGACTTIDRGTLDDTVIHDGVIIDNLVQIAHNVVIGENTAVAACTGIAGSAIIGARCRLGGSVGIVGHIRICDDVTLLGGASVTRPIDEPGEYGSAPPLFTASRWRRYYAWSSRLDEMGQRIKKLEQTVRAGRQR